MKNLILMLVVVLLFGAAQFTFGQTYFNTGEECVAAAKAGTAQVYHPKAFNLHKKVNPKVEVKTQLETDVCIEMIVDISTSLRDFKWIFQKAGTWMVKELGGMQMKRRFDCGNPTNRRIPILDETPTPPKVAYCPNAPYTGVKISEIGNFNLELNAQGQCVPKQPPVDYCKTVNGGPNLVSLTIAQASILTGWEVVNGDCRQKQAPPPAPTCPNAPYTGVKISEVAQNNLEIYNGQCVVKEPVCVTVNGKPAVERLTLRVARESGYKVNEKTLACEMKGGGGFWSGLARVGCGAGTGYILDSVRTGDWWSLRSLGAAGAGGGAGAATFGIPWAKESNHWYTGCLGGLIVYLIPVNDDGSCPYGSTPVYGADGKITACGTKNPPAGASQVGSVQTRPKILMGFAGETVVGGQPQTATEQQKPDSSKPTPKVGNGQAGKPF